MIFSKTAPFFFHPFLIIFSACSKEPNSLFAERRMPLSDGM
jgi:hypothetical protein